jgi:uncharacterized damage-inducible protein DinB
MLPVDLAVSRLHTYTMPRVSHLGDTYRKKSSGMWSGALSRAGWGRPRPDLHPNAGSAGTRLTSEATVPFMPDRRTPFHLAGEKQTLQDFLAYLRESVILKVADLDEVSARRSTVPTGTCLLGLVKHLTRVEVVWFHVTFAGGDVVIPTGEIQPVDSVASAVAAYQAAVQTNGELVDRCDDLDQLCARTFRTPEPMSLRWLLVHMIEETARHAGHADIVREQIDGRTGR